MKNFRDIAESNKISLKEIFSFIKSNKKFTKLKRFIKIVDNRLRVVSSSSSYMGFDEALEFLEEEWTKKGGEFYEYFKKEYNIEFKVEEYLMQFNADKEFHDITEDGIVGIFLTIK